MKKIAGTFLAILFCSTITFAQDTLASDNEELKQLYKEDQGDRHGKIDWKVVSKRDEERRTRVLEMLEAKQVVTSNDYANAAMIFQHGGDTIASTMAVNLMRKAIELDPKRNKWLLAAAIDRDLMRKKKPQIYGTQYVKSSAEAQWELYELDPTKITDEERMEYGVETIAQQQARVKTMNKKKLYELMDEGKSVDDIIALAKSADLKNSEYNFSEGSFNNLGYELMNAGKDEDALKIFKLNTELYPNGYNTYDSYGECLLKVGRTEEGIEAYKKSLELNPKNNYAKQVIEKHQH